MAHICRHFLAHPFPSRSHPRRSSSLFTASWLLTPLRRPTDLTLGVRYCTHVQASLELSLVAHLDVDPLVQTEADEVERLLDGAGRGRGRRRRGPRHL